jgi:signal transduction histidine kinase/ligand-binding sensor domain-containing protein/CheY-like chemotaxis protein
MKYLLIGFLLIQHSVNSFTKEVALTFSHINVKQGISNNWVRCIYQDDRGYIWFGTADGLNRFDGYKCEIYRPYSEGKYALGNISVYDILNKDTDELWVCTDMGVYTYNYISAELKPYPLFERHAVLCMIRDHNQDIWFGTNQGLYCFDPADSTLNSFHADPGDPNSISDNYIHVLYQDPNRNLWIGTQHGLNLYLKEQERFIRFLSGDAKGKLASDEIMSITSDKHERLWVGSARGGLDILEFDLAANHKTITNILAGDIIDLLIDSRNFLWIIKGLGEGISRIDLNTFKAGQKFDIGHSLHDPLRLHSLSDNSPFCLFMDDAQDIWIGTFGSGVNYFSYRTKKFTVVRNVKGKLPTISGNLVNAFFEDKQYLWIGTESGLSRYDKISGTYRSYVHDSRAKSSLGNNAVYSILRDSQQNLWVGTWGGGLNRYVPEKESFIRYLPNSGEGSISSANIFSIYEDSRGNLWIGTIGGGLNKFDYESERFTSFKHENEVPGSIYSDAINFITETSDGRVLISTYHSIDEYDYANNSFTRVRTKENDSLLKNEGYILSIYEDSRKQLWLASNVGLEVIAPSGEIKAVFTLEDGLPDNTIQGILEDNEGSLWISTNKGLCRFMSAVELPENPKFMVYTSSDGLSSNEFKQRAAYSDSNGRFYFGSNNGFTHFHPDSISNNYILPRVVISEILMLSSLPDEGDKYRSIGPNANELKTLELSFRNANFIIRFSALNYLNPEKNRYKYRLEGYDNDWIIADEHRVATYTNMEPGKYTFLVMGSNNDGVWCDLPKTLSIIISPPWWKTTIVRGTAVILLLILVMVLYRIRFSILERQKRLLKERVAIRTNELIELNLQLNQKQEEISKQNIELEKHRHDLEEMIRKRTGELEKAKLRAEESDRLKSSFLANMSHEIRTPMNAIVGFSSLLKERKLNKKERNRYIEVITNNCDTLMVLIDDIVDVSLIEADQLSLSQDVFIANEVLEELERYYLLHLKKEIVLKYVNRNNTTELILNTDKIRFRQIFNNLLNNAVKYTNQGKIEFGYEIHANHILFFVSDTGIGIPGSYHRKIFNHFQRIESRTSRLFRGAGIGLSICKKIVELMGGEIWVKSEPGHGSVFYFTIPKSEIKSTQRIPKPDEIISYDLNDITVLIAEDDDINFELLQNILTITGADVRRAKNGNEAVDYIRSHADKKNLIVLMDLKMPDMDGFESHRQIKSIREDVPVIAVTAYAQLTDQKRVRDEKFSDYLPKPINPNLLLKILAEHASKQRPGVSNLSP